MSPVDEARVLLARHQERERECAERAAERDELPCRPVLDMPPALLAALCAEVAALREYHAASEAYLAEIGPVREPATAVRGSLTGARIAARERLAAAQHALAAKGEDR